MTPIHRAAVRAVLAAAAVLAVTACGADGETAGTGSTPGSAASEQRVTLYSGRSEDLVAPLLEQFTDRTGIAVDVRYGETAQLAAQLLEEGERTPADAFLAQDAGALGAVSEAGLFVPLPDSVLDRVPENYRGDEGVWVGVTGRARVVAYDPDQVEPADLPRSIDDLTDPAWKGKIGIAPTNASFQAFITAIRVADGDAAAREFLAGLKANDVQTREKNSIILDDVEAGRLALGLINHYYWYEKAAEIGADEMNAELHFLKNGDPGALVNVSGIGITRRTAGNPGAGALVDYLLSEEGQRYFAETTWEYPMIAEVPAAEALPSLAELNPPAIDLDDLAALEETITMISESGLA